MARYRRVARKVSVPVVEARPAPPDYDALLKGDLVLLAESKGVDSSGTKADIIARLKT